MFQQPDIKGFTCIEKPQLVFFPIFAHLRIINAMSLLTLYTKTNVIFSLREKASGRLISAIHINIYL